MKYLKRREKLDMILRYLKRFDAREISVTELTNYLETANPQDFTIDEINKATNKLILDGCINNADPGFYHLTLKGIVMLESGGYVAQKKANIIRARYQRYSEKFDDRGPSLVPWVIAIAAILFIYGVLQFGYMHWGWRIPF